MPWLYHGPGGGLRCCQPPWTACEGKVRISSVSPGVCLEEHGKIGELGLCLFWETLCFLSVRRNTFGDVLVLNWRCAL